MSGVRQAYPIPAASSRWGGGDGAVGTVRGIEHSVHKTARPREIRARAVALGVAPVVVAEFRPSLGLAPATAPAGGPGAERLSA